MEGSKLPNSGEQMPPHSLHQLLRRSSHLLAHYSLYIAGWAKLRSLQGNVPTFELTAESVCRLALWLPRASQWSVRRMLASQSSVGMQMTIGRNAACACQIEDTRISGTHCRIFRENGECKLEDLSTNGTFVNGKR